MPTTTLPPDFPGSVDTLSESQRDALAASAAALKHAALAGGAHRPLQGKNLGLICEAEDSPDAVLFEQAAQSLGARVVRIRPSVAGLTDGPVLPQTARVLGRLYDAIECQGLPPELVEQIRIHAGVPVYDALAGEHPATDALAHRLDNGATGAGNRRYVLQALLLGSVG